MEADQTGATQEQPAATQTHTKFLLLGLSASRRHGRVSTIKGRGAQFSEKQ